MALEELMKAKKRVVGTKQTKKAVEKGIAQKVYVAQDAEAHVTGPLLELCKERGVEVVPVESMRQLGEACGIQVGAASAAILGE